MWYNNCCRNFINKYPKYTKEEFNMNFKELLLESYRDDMVKRLIKKGYDRDVADIYVELSINEPIENVITDILIEEKQLSPDEVVSFLRMVQKAKGVPNLLEKKLRRKKNQEVMVFNNKKLKLADEGLTPKISSQMISGNINVTIAQHQEKGIKALLATTPRIIVDLDRIPYINEIRFDIKPIGGEKLKEQYIITPLADAQNYYTGIVEILVDPQLWGGVIELSESD